MRSVRSGISQPNVSLCSGTPPRVSVAAWDEPGMLVETHVREPSSVGLKKEERKEKAETLTQVWEKAAHPLNKRFAVNTTRLAFWS